MDEINGFGRGSGFLWACKDTQAQFDAWTENLSEEQLRAGFRNFAEIREHLEKMIHTTQHILSTGTSFRADSESK